MSTIPPKTVYRIKHDIKTFMKDPPPGIFGVSDENDYMVFHALVIGVDGTPYEKGFFYFVLKFPPNYPHSPPDVKFMTTGGGTVRMNPNLYESGKVCLSILGTWPGPRWTAALSLSSVLMSIQSLLNEEPYYNEPGKLEDANASMQYNEVILHETLRIAVVGMVRNDCYLQIPCTFQVHIQQLFARNIDYYEALATKKWALTGNIILDPLYDNKGHKGLTFNYAGLAQDLKTIKKQLQISKD